MAKRVGILAFHMHGGGLGLLRHLATFRPHNPTRISLNAFLFNDMSLVVFYYVSEIYAKCAGTLAWLDARPMENSPPLMAHGAKGYARAVYA